MMISQAAILQHPTYASSNEIVKAFKVKTFHHHYHILLPLLHLTQAKTYLELGTYAGGSLKLATTYQGLAHAISIDTYQHFTPEQVLVNVGKVKARITQHKALTSDKNILRLLYRDHAPSIDLLFIDAGHSYQDVLNDFNHYYALVRPGGVIVFDDYGDNVYSPEVKRGVDAIVRKHPELSVIGVLPNQAGSFGNKVPGLRTSSNEFIVQKPYLPAPTTFGICMATYNHGKVEAVKKMLDSLVAQTCTDWTLFVIGDRHTDEAGFRRLLPSDKVVFVNLPIACERDFLTRGHTFWLTAGATAMNYSVELIKQAKCSYIAHLDDDDLWTPNHLKVIRDKYQSDPELSFVFTRGLHVNGRIIPANNSPIPSRGTVLHSAISWNPSKLTIILPYTSHIPADAVILEEVAGKCRAGTHKSALCPEVTVTHQEEGSSR